MQWLVFISILAVVYCRPQEFHQQNPLVSSSSSSSHNFEEKIENPRQIKESPAVEESTKEILKKIEELNEKQGLRQKKRPTYHPFAYFRSQQQQQRDGFKFPQESYQNYEAEARISPDSFKFPQNYEYPEARISQEAQISPAPDVKTYVRVDPFPTNFYQQNPIPISPPPVDEDKIPPGHYIKRKIVHQQQFLVPMNYPNPTQDTVNNIKNIIDGYGYGYQPESTRPLRQSSPQWPFAQYFPIIIRDPVMQMVNAFTSIIEYGPTAGQGDKCKKTSTKQETKDKMKPRMNNDDEEDDDTILDIEDFIISDQSKEMKFNLTLRNARSLNNDDEVHRTFIFNASAYPTIQTVKVNQEEIRDIHSPPRRDQNLYEDETAEDYKADEIQVSNDGNKKLFSKDNTGSGIFIHKIKVRKGGVAIAGPGGIATAGSGGTAIVGPNGYAFTQPNSLAIAGSGSKVVAVDPNVDLSQVVNGTMEENNPSRPGRPGRPPRLGKVVAVGPVIYYNKGGIFRRTYPKVTILPYYGGAKGQSLQIIEDENGSIITSIIPTPPSSTTTTTTTTGIPEEIDSSELSELENPPLPTKNDQEFGKNINRIHNTALNIIKLQQIAKKNGRLTEKEQELYRENMDTLNESALSLAQYQEDLDELDSGTENREGLNAWFERKKQTAKKDKDKDKKKQEEEKRRKEEEEKEKMRTTTEEEIEENEDSDAIAIGLPPDNASVAEAKPVGLAVAGEGGVAASKPIATAVVGPDGLAIARPVATAIAGVSPDQALVPIYAEGFIGASKPKRYGSTGTTKADTASEYLNKLIHKYHQY